MTGRGRKGGRGGGGDTINADAGRTTAGGQQRHPARHTQQPRLLQLAWRAGHWSLAPSRAAAEPEPSTAYLATGKTHLQPAAAVACYCWRICFASSIVTSTPPTTTTAAAAGQLSLLLELSLKPCASLILIFILSGVRKTNGSNYLLQSLPELEGQLVTSHLACQHQTSDTSNRRQSKGISSFIFFRYDTNGGRRATPPASYV